GSDEARKTDDLPAPELERDVGEDPAARQAVRAEHNVAALRLFLGEERVERAPDHQPDDLAVRELARGARLDVPAVAQDGDRVGELADLFEAMADVDHRDAAVSQLAHGDEEIVD